jgi:hypothetical protein
MGQYAGRLVRLLAFARPGGMNSALQTTDELTNELGMHRESRSPGLSI